MAIPMPSEAETFEQQMSGLTADLIAAFNRGDAKACAAFYQEDATVLIPDRPPVKGHAAIEALLGEYTAAGTKMAFVDPVEFGSSGELGYCVGTYQLDVPAEDGSRTKETGKFVSVLRLQADGSWKAVVDSLIRDCAAGA